MAQRYVLSCRIKGYRRYWHDVYAAALNLLFHVLLIDLLSVRRHISVGIIVI